MKILHINGTSSGGAYNVAHILHKYLLERNVDSYIFIPSNKNLKNQLIFNSNSLSQKIKIIFSKILIKLLPRSNQTSTFGIFSSKQLKKTIKIIKPNIIHLHWVGNEILSINQIIRSNIPLVVTLHDMWFFLPYSHYSVGILEKKNFLSNLLSKYLIKQKKKLNSGNSKFVATSEWMKKSITNSKYYDRNKIIKIPIGIDFNIWYPENKNFSKNYYNFEKEKKVILFTAMGPNNFRKGIDILYESLKYVNFDYKLVISSDVEVNYKDFKKFTFLKNINDLNKRRILYSACDILAAPSKVEAFGLAALEASTCNLPSVVFKNTGFEEIIINKKNGYTAEFLDVKDFTKGINWISEKIDENNLYFDTCRELVRKKFDINNFVDDYINLYKKTINQENK